MIRLILNLLLAFAFLANGLASANGHQAHADGEGCQHETALVDHAAMGHAGHHDMTATAHAAADDTEPADSGDCCGNVGCKCRCAVPTVAVTPGIATFPQSTSSAPAVALVAHAVIRRSTAPFRPPSV